MKKLGRYKHAPIIGPIVKSAINLVTRREANKISRHFAEYFSPILANNDELKEETFKIRHKVFSEELKIENIKRDLLETDSFDEHASHCLIKHLPSGAYAGTVRIVSSANTNQLLPIEKYCRDSITHEDIHPGNFPRHEICEVSRLAIPKQFRKRETDKFMGSATGGINDHVYSERELRCFPFIVVGLYLSATSLALLLGYKHCFVMMEPNLVRSLRFVGFPFQKIGTEIDYQGIRTPYYISRKSLLNGLSPSFLHLLKMIKKTQSDSLKL